MDWWHATSIRQNPLTYGCQCSCSLSKPQQTVWRICWLPYVHNFVMRMGSPCMQIFFAFLPVCIRVVPVCVRGSNSDVWATFHLSHALNQIFCGVHIKKRMHIKTWSQYAYGDQDHPPYAYRDYLFPACIWWLWFCWSPYAHGDDGDPHMHTESHLDPHMHTGIA